MIILEYTAEVGAFVNAFVVEVFLKIWAWVAFSAIPSGLGGLADVFAFVLEFILVGRAFGAFTINIHRLQPRTSIFTLLLIPFLILFTSIHTLIILFHPYLIHFTLVSALIDLSYLVEAAVMAGGVFEDAVDVSALMYTNITLRIRILIFITK